MPYKGLSHTLTHTHNTFHAHKHMNCICASRGGCREEATASNMMVVLVCSNQLWGGKKDYKSQMYAISNSRTVNLKMRLHNARTLWRILEKWCGATRGAARSYLRRWSCVYVRLRLSELKFHILQHLCRLVCDSSVGLAVCVPILRGFLLAFVHIYAPTIAHQVTI